MGKSQIAVRVPPALLEKLNHYIDRTGVTKTMVIVDALAQYLDGVEELSLCQRLTALEAKVKELQQSVKP